MHKVTHMGKFIRITRHSRCFRGYCFLILKDIGTEHNVFLAVFYAAPIFIWLHLISLYKVYVDSKIH